MYFFPTRPTCFQRKDSLIKLRIGQKNIKLQQDIQLFIYKYMYKCILGSNSVHFLYLHLGECKMQKQDFTQDSLVFFTRYTSHGTNSTNNKVAVIESIISISYKCPLLMEGSMDLRCKPTEICMWPSV